MHALNITWDLKATSGSQLQTDIDARASCNIFLPISYTSYLRGTSFYIKGFQKPNHAAFATFFANCCSPKRYDGAIILMHVEAWVWLAQHLKIAPLPEMLFKVAETTVYEAGMAVQPLNPRV